MGDARTHRLALTLGVAALIATLSGPVPVSAGSPERPTFESTPSEGPTGTTVAVAGAGCFAPGTTDPTEAAVVRMVADDGTVPASTSALVEPDGSWSGQVAVPAGTEASTYRVEARCVIPGDSGADPVVYERRSFTVTGEGSAAQPEAPANPNINGPIEPFPRYDGQTTCSPSAKPGTVAYRDLVLRAYPGTGDSGIGRACSVGGTSEHKEGRAWDWTLNAGSAADRAKAQDLFNWLFATDAECNEYANARRLGIMYIIWNRRFFAVYDVGDGWTPYNGSSPHTDHVHFSLTRAGANKTTSFWRAPPAPSGWTPGGYDVQNGPSGTPAVNPLPGDFDGDTHEDLLYYVPGPGQDYVLYGRGDGTFSTRTVTVGRDYQPLVGDFNGDCRSDVLWYGAGSAPDALWRGKADRTFTGVSIAVNGTYSAPTVGDYNGDTIDDIVWYQPGATQDHLWYGTVFGFQGRQVTINRTYTPLSGDYDGDGREDILWFGGGAAPDALWYGNRGGGFTGRKINRTEDSDPPVVGDYNGDGRDDILWYGPGAALDGLWTGNANRSFSARAITVTGTFAAPVAADFDDNFRDDVFWVGGPDSSRFWRY